MKNTSDYIASPCIGVCMLQKINNVTSCTGCKRTPYEIRNWTILTNKQREDIIIDDMLVVDRINELYLTGMELDYTYDDFESAFVFNNPKATSSCGCGTSFSA
mgnify:CR=1 FL=1